MAEVTVQRFRKKPVQVQGVRYTGDNDGELAAFVGTSYAHPVRRENDSPGSNWLPAHHGQGAKVWNSSQSAWNDVNPGDTVLRGLVGEHYPCSPDALAATYEPAAAGQFAAPAQGTQGDVYVQVGGSGPRDRDLNGVTRELAPGVLVDFDGNGAVDGVEVQSARSVEIDGKPVPAAPAHEDATTDTVVAERRRQVQVKGFTTEHDLRYTNGELVSAALAYLTGDPAWWPWQDVPEGRSAVKAGAMLLAERDRHLAEVGLQALREGRR